MKDKNNISKEHLEKAIKELEKTSKLLEPKQNQRDKWNSEVLSYSNKFINTIDTAKAFCYSKENGKDIYDLNYIN